MFKFKGLLLFFLVIFNSCEVNNRFPDEFNLFEGKWQLESSNTYEIWSKHKDQLTGSVIKTENKDTLIVENLRILSERNEIFYEASVPAQNNGKAIRFTLTYKHKNTFKFENPEHDFPQTIVYEFESRDTLLATIAGKEAQRTFTYIKTKD